MSETPTPRTAKEKWTIINEESIVNHKMEVVSAEFALQLECKLAAMTKERDEFKAAGVGVSEDLGRMKRMYDDREASIRRAMERISGLMPQNDCGDSLAPRIIEIISEETGVK